MSKSTSPKIIQVNPPLKIQKSTPQSGPPVLVLEEHAHRVIRTTGDRRLRPFLDTSVVIVVIHQ
jgi:hypothetical protein